MKAIENPTARVWPTATMNKIVKMCKDGGHQVNRKDDMIEITNPDNGDVIVRGLKNGAAYLIRYNTKYFE